MCQQIVPIRNIMQLDLGHFGRYSHLKFVSLGVIKIVDPKRNPQNSYLHLKRFQYSLEINYLYASFLCFSKYFSYRVSMLRSCRGI